MPQISATSKAPSHYLICKFLGLQAMRPHGSCSDQKYPWLFQKGDLQPQNLLHPQEHSKYLLTDAAVQ